MKNLITLLTGLTLLALALTLAGCDFFKNNDTKAAVVKPINIQTVKERDVLLVGVKGDTYKFGYQDPHTGVIDGFDVDIAKALAKKILGSDKKLKAVAVTTATRGPLLDNGELDYVIATFTITEERKNIYNFTNAYFVDSGIGCMVKKESGISNMLGLNNKRVGVARGTTAVKSMQNAASVLGIKINLVELEIYPDVKAALNAGEVDCFATNGIILMSYLDDTVMLLNERLAPQSYGIVSRKGNNELTKVANDLIDELKLSGEMNKIIVKWGLK